MVKALIRISSVGMVILVAGEPVVEELLQEACTPEAVAREGIDLLTNTARVLYSGEAISQYVGISPNGVGFLTLSWRELDE